MNIDTQADRITATNEKRWVWSLDEIETVYQRHDNDKERVLGLLGGKGANLAEIARIGLLIPPGFTVTTEACMEYLQGDQSFPDSMWKQIAAQLRILESVTDKELGNPLKPLLVSCRSGARYSMPGMMDTVLNIGLNDSTVEGLAKARGDSRFAFDCYRRLIQMYATVVRGLDDEPFEEVLSEFRSQGRIEANFEETDWRRITDAFKTIYRQESGDDFPQDPMLQIRNAIESVFSSWNGKRAIDYRNATKIPHDLGTACNVVTMVFGNLGQRSGTGVAFTRNPSTGENEIFGEYLMSAQGEDVVAGIRNAKPIGELAEEMPECYEDFVAACRKLEDHFKDMQDLEFTIEDGKFWLLQTRSGKRTPEAAVKVAVDLANAGSISREEAVLRVDPQQIDALLHPQFQSEAKQKARDNNRLLAKGINASPGAAVGQIAFDADLAEEWGSKQGIDVIMVRPFTRPDDVHGMLASKGILTCEGGATSHAAVVARQFGVPCIVGASHIEIDPERRVLTANGVRIAEGDIVSIDGATGEVFSGPIATAETKLAEDRYLSQLLSWADAIRRLEIRANADAPRDADTARRFGASGIGLCRTEHMFFAAERLPHMQRMILAESESARNEELDTLLDFQRNDFKGLFRSMDGLPVVFRLLDPPLHEFLPDAQNLRDEIFELRLSGKTHELPKKEKLLKQIERHHESNPMMGLRGIRLGLLYPEVIRMQVSAILEAAIAVKQRGIQPMPEIMIPLTCGVTEFKTVKEIVASAAKDTQEKLGESVAFKIGTMIEIPRACMVAGELAKEAEFFSFGTNDLTQMTFGFSRDDAERSFLPHYLKSSILPANPFQTLDVDGVGSLIRKAMENAQASKTDVKAGICGEHGGDPESINFFHKHGFDYVSCSPFRVPVARLSAAHAALSEAD